MPLIANKLFFIHIPKTSGTSLYANLLNNDIPFENFIDNTSPISCQHYHLKLIPKKYNKLKKFTIIRDPWLRTLSAYCYRNRKQHTFDINHFNKWLYITFIKFKKNPSVWNNHFRPQIDFIDDNTKLFLFDDIGACHDWLCKELRIVNNFNEHRCKNHISDIQIDPKECEVYSVWKEIYKQDIELYERVRTEQNSQHYSNI